MPLPCDATLGEIAYPSYKPQQAGVIVEILPKSDGRPSGAVVIETLAGKRVTTVVYERFTDLVEGHRRKLAKHEAALVTLRARRRAIGL